MFARRLSRHERVGRRACRLCGVVCTGQFLDRVPNTGSMAVKRCAYSARTGVVLGVRKHGSRQTHGPPSRFAPRKCSPTESLVTQGGHAGRRQRGRIGLTVIATICGDHRIRRA